MTDHKIVHKAYHHIVNSSVKSRLLKCDDTSMVIVEEKIDGSNFYFASDGINVIRGKRGSTITDTTSFYGCEDTLYLKESMLTLYTRLSITDGTLYLYGELIPTQKRIRYLASASKTYFIAFNLRFVPFDQENVEDAPAIWLPKEQWAPIAIECGFLVIPTLLVGTLHQCLDFDVENIKSCVPQLIDANSKIVSSIEGVVIKGDGFTFKKKAQAFRETETGGGISLKRREKDTVGEAVCDLIGSMLTPSRIDNIVSQIGEKMLPDALRLANTVVLDAINEAKDDEDSVIYKVSKSKLSKIQKEIAPIFAETVRQHMNW